jgi:hypothetical protein
MALPWFRQTTRQAPKNSAMEEARQPHSRLPPVAPQNRQPLRLEAHVRLFVAQDALADPAQHRRAGGLPERRVVNLGDYLRRDQHAHRDLQAHQVAQPPEDGVYPTLLDGADALRGKVIPQVSGMSLLLPDKVFHGPQVFLVPALLCVLRGAPTQVPAFGALAELELLYGRDHSLPLRLREPWSSLRQNFRFLVGPEMLEPLAGAPRALMYASSPGISHDECASYLISGPKDPVWVSIQA